MSEIAKLLRIIAQADKEFKVSTVVVRGEPAKFTSQLSGDALRKKFIVYNASASGSGEIVMGASTDRGLDGEGFIIKKGEYVNIPLAPNLDVYFSNTVSGENCNLRIFEGA